MSLIAFGISMVAVLHGLNDWSVSTFNSYWPGILIQAVSLLLFIGYTMSASSIERQVRRTRAKFERELRQRRTTVQRNVKQNRRQFERQVKSVRKDFEKQSGVVTARVDKLVSDAQGLIS